MTKIQVRSGTAAGNPVLAVGEPGYNTTTKELKIGDGVTAFNSLPTLAQTSATVNLQTGTSYTLALADATKVIECNNASPFTLTIPPNSSVAFPTGTIIPVDQIGAGQVTLVPGAAVTIRSRGSALSIAAQYSSACLRKRGADEWVLTGDIA